MDESALRRKALESMLKKKEGRDGAKGEIDPAEDGEILSPSDGDSKLPSVVARKSKWADDEEGGSSDTTSHSLPDGGYLPGFAALALCCCCLRALTVVFFPPDERAVIFSQACKG